MNTDLYISNFDFTLNDHADLTRILKYLQLVKSCLERIARSDKYINLLDYYMLHNYCYTYSKKFENICTKFAIELCLDRSHFFMLPISYRELNSNFDKLFNTVASLERADITRFTNDRQIQHFRVILNTYLSEPTSKNYLALKKAFVDDVVRNKTKTTKTLLRKIVLLRYHEELILKPLEKAFDFIYGKHFTTFHELIDINEKIFSYNNDEEILYCLSLISKIRERSTSNTIDSVTYATCNYIHNILSNKKIYIRYIASFAPFTSFGIESRLNTQNNPIIIDSVCFALEQFFINKHHGSTLSALGEVNEHIAKFEFLLSQTKISFEGTEIKNRLRKQICESFYNDLLSFLHNNFTNNFLLVSNVSELSNTTLEDTDVLFIWTQSVDELFKFIEAENVNNIENLKKLHININQYFDIFNDLTTNDKMFTRLQGDAKTVFERVKEKKENLNRDMKIEEIDTCLICCLVGDASEWDKLGVDSLLINALKDKTLHDDTLDLLSHYEKSALINRKYLFAHRLQQILEGDSWHAHP